MNSLRVLVHTLLFLETKYFWIRKGHCGYAIYPEGTLSNGPLTKMNDVVFLFSSFSREIHRHCENTVSPITQ